MKGEKHCQNKRQTSIDFILTENSANIFKFFFDGQETHN